MFRVKRRQGSEPTTARGRAGVPAVEILEERQLLSLYNGPTRVRPVQAGHAYYQLTLTGPGYETVSAIGKGAHKTLAINLYGTTAGSQLTVSLLRAAPGYGKGHSALPIGAINVASGQLGGVSAGGTANLMGAISPISGVQSLSFNTLGPNAQINVNGGINSFQVGSANLGPNGGVHIAGSVSGNFTVGALTLNGGKVLIDGDVTGLNLGGITLQNSGQFLIGHDINGSASLGTVNINGGRLLVTHDVATTLNTGNLTVQNTGQFIVGDDLNSLQVNGSEQIQTSGLFQVGTDLGTMGIVQGMTVATSGKWIVGRDVLDGITMNSNLTLDSGGSIAIGRNLTVNNINGSTSTQTAFLVNGNVVFTPTAGTFSVGGNVDGFTINGTYQGRGNTSTSSPEFIVGLDLNNFTVISGSAGQGSVSNANIAVAKSINSMNIAHGIFYSFITAGVAISNSIIGPDGDDAVLDSELRAATRISGMAIDGNVRSDYITNPQPNPPGYRTRIIAGEDRQGNWYNYAIINGLNIGTNPSGGGSLIDAVVASSVQPNGGNGSLPPTGYAPIRQQSNVPGDGGTDTYDAPAGLSRLRCRQLHGA